MVPDSKLAREAAELVRDTESPLLFNHSTRVYYFSSLAGKRRGLKFDPELLYIVANWSPPPERQHLCELEYRKAFAVRFLSPSTANLG